MNYVDDFGGVLSQTEPMHMYSKTLEVFADLGFDISEDKCCVPSTRMIFRQAL